MAHVSSDLIKVLFESNFRHAVSLKLVGKLAAHLCSTRLERLVSTNCARRILVNTKKKKKIVVKFYALKMGKS